MTKERLSQDFLAILAEELIPATGCTEPIALAYAAAKARLTLGRDPERIFARCSGNIIKNVRCVCIPNSGGRTGIETAVAMGAFAGDAARVMGVLSKVNDSNRERAIQFVDNGCVAVEHLQTEQTLHFIVELICGGDSSVVEVCGSHTHIVSIVKNGEAIYTADGDSECKKETADRSGLCLKAIKDFADSVDLNQLTALYDRLIECNMAIAEEGLKGDYGLSLGRMLLDSCPDCTLTRMKAYAAAASEARMSGCDLPVVINSGSGNQGIASSVPVIVYARETGVDNEKLYRALAFSSLMTVYQKEYIGLLSAFCGVVSACCASAAAITYMTGGDEKQIGDTLQNALANIPGIICDGAKASCGAKIATCIDAAMTAHYLAVKGRSYPGGFGILKQNADETVRAVGNIAREGMYDTDRVIIAQMLK